MDEDDNKQSEQFDASFSLPSNKPPKEGKNSEDRNAAADLIRKKVEAAYGHEPDYRKEAEDASGRTPDKRSQHQQFIYELTSSGRPMHEVQTAWHEYYAGLTDAQKHEVWQEFYSTHAQNASHPAVARSKPATVRKFAKSVRTRPRKTAAKPLPATRRTPKDSNPSPVHSVLFGLGIGSITLLIFLFGFFNERIIAPFIQPSRNVSNIPIITTSAVGPDPEVVIPKINVEIPVVYDVDTIEEKAVEKGLERGVVHYADTAEPGQNGNIVIVGHSSNNILNRGKYKFAFVLLHKLEVGDTFYLQKDGKRYTYQVYKKEVVKPTDVSVLGPADKPATATLITCDPPGLSTNRLIVIGEQISPDPIANAPATVAAQPQRTAVIPGNSPSLWSRITKWFES